MDRRYENKYKHTKNDLCVCSNNDELWQIWPIHVNSMLLWGHRYPSECVFFSVLILAGPEMWEMYGNVAWQHRNSLRASWA